jgi:hypothetical protein
MRRTVEAVSGLDHVVQPVEPIDLPEGQRLLILVPEEALLAEPALHEWLMPDEEARWSYLSQARS